MTLIIHQINFKEFINIYKKCTTKSYSFLVIVTFLALDNPLNFRKNIKITRTIYATIRDEKLQYDVNKEATKIPALSLGEFDKYEYHTGEDVLPSDPSRIIEEAKFTYSL